MKAKVMTLGEIMVRLKPPGFERWFQSPFLEATFGGGEANVAISLATLGLEVSFLTVLPANPIADACVADLKGRGVDTSMNTCQPGESRRACHAAAAAGVALGIGVGSWVAIPAAIIMPTTATSSTMSM